MNIKDVAFWLMMLLVFGLTVYLLFYIKTESFACLSNPYTYSIDLLEEANDAEVSCICSSDDATVLLTREGFSEIQVTRDQSLGTFNISFLESLR